VQGKFFFFLLEATSKGNQSQIAGRRRIVIKDHLRIEGVSGGVCRGLVFDGHRHKARDVLRGPANDKEERCG
jgi:hypothetical protein